HLFSLFLISPAQPLTTSTHLPIFNSFSCLPLPCYPLINSISVPLSPVSASLTPSGSSALRLTQGLQKTPPNPPRSCRPLHQIPRKTRRNPNAARPSPKEEGGPGESREGED